MLFRSNVFIVCQNTPPFNTRPWSLTKHLYAEELAWFDSYRFEKDLSQSFVPWQSSYANYHNIWGNYKIEVVCETHANSEYWFTEKTARCLITGKPFVLLSGPGTLARLQNMGFRTFGEIIDESYDLIDDPLERLEKIVSEMQRLSSLPKNKKQKLWHDLYKISKYNQQRFFSTNFHDDVVNEFVENLKIGVEKCSQNKTGHWWKIATDPSIVNEQFLDQDQIQAIEQYLANYAVSRV